MIETADGRKRMLPTLLLMAAAVLNACELPTGAARCSEEVGATFNLSLSGATDAVRTGQAANFLLPDGLGKLSSFSIHLSVADIYDGTQIYFTRLNRNSKDQPRVGTYSIGPRGDSGAEFEAVLKPPIPPFSTSYPQNGFRGTEGAITIISSGTCRIEGAFRFSSRDERGRILNSSGSFTAIRR